MKKIIGISMLIAGVLLPASFALAQVFSQNQVILPPLGNNGFVVSTSTSNGAKLSATSTPFFSNLFFRNATGTNSFVMLGTTTLSTTTAAVINGTVVVDGVHFPQTIAGIKSAVATASSTGAGMIYLPCADYGTITDDNIEIPGNTIFQGSGWCTKITLAGTASILMQNASSTIDRIHTEAPNHTSGFSVYIKNTNGIAVTNSFIMNNYNFGIFIQSKNGCCGYATTSNVRIQGNTVTGLGNADVIGGGPDVIQYQNVNSVYITQNTIEQHPEIEGSAHYQYAIDMVGVDRMTFTDNKTIGAIAFGSEQTPNVQSIITGNTVTATASTTAPNNALISVIARPAYVSLTVPERQIIVSNNVVNGGYIQVVGSSLQRGTGFNIIGNNVRAYNQNFSIIAQFMSFGTISGNVEAGGGTGIALVASDSITVTNNMLLDNFAYGYSESTSGDNLLEGNTFLRVGVPIPIRMDTLSNTTIIGQNFGAFDSAQAFPGITQLYGMVGVATSSPFAYLSIGTPYQSTGATTTLFAIGSSTLGLATTTLFTISNTGSTTAANGFNITGGCFSVNSVCVTNSSGFSTTSANYWASLGLAWSTTSAAYFKSQFQDWTFASSALTPTTTLGIIVNASSSISALSSINGTTTNSTTSNLYNSLGVLSIASSTFGNGNQNGGLTISGGATTTGLWSVVSGSTVVGQVGNISSTMSIKSFNGNGIQFVAGSGNTQLLVMSDSGQFLFRRSGALMTIGTSTANTAWKLQVNGTRPCFTMSDASAGTNMKHFVQCNQNGIFTLGTSTDGYATSTPAIITVNSSGTVGISTSSPWRTLSVNGTVGFSGLTSAGVGAVYVCLSTNNELQTGATCAASTKKVKNNILTLSPALSKVMLLRPVSFTYKKGYFGQRDDEGFIAEEVAAVDPLLAISAATTSTLQDGSVIKKGDPMALNLPAIVSIVTKAVQEIEQQIQSILSRLDGNDKQIKALQAKIDAQQKQIDAISAKLK